MVVFAVLLMAASYLISQMTAGQDMKIIKDLGLAALSIFGLLIAVFIGIGLVSKEVERKSVYGLLTKPVTRAAIRARQVRRPGDDAARQLGGDDHGVLRACSSTWMLTATDGAAPAWPAPAIDPRLLIAIVLIFAELMVVTARGAVLLDVLEPAAGDAADAWPVGRGTLQRRSAELRERRRRRRPSRWIARALYYMLPNLAPFDVKAEVVHGMPVAVRHVGLHAGVRGGLHRHRC